MPPLPALQRIDHQQQHKRNHQHHQRHRSGTGVVVLLKLADDDERRDLGDHRHIASDKDHRAVFANRPRKRHRKTGQQRRRNMRKKHPGENLQARSAQRGGGFFKFFFSVFQHRLHRAHHERQADKNQCDHDASRCERELDPQRLQVLPDPAIAGQQRRQRNAGDGGRQRKRQINQRINKLLAGKFVAHQHPGQQQTKHQVHQRSDQRRAKGELVRRQHARRCDGHPELVKRHCKRLEEQRRYRNQHDQGEVQQRVAQRQPESGQHASRGSFLANRCRRHRGQWRTSSYRNHDLLDGVDLVELATVVEMDFLRFAERAEHFLHREQLQWLEGGGVFLQYGR